MLRYHLPVHYGHGRSIKKKDGIGKELHDNIFEKA